MQPAKLAKERFNLNTCNLLSLCHSLIRREDEELDHVIGALNWYFQKHGTRSRLSYNVCCNTFTTANGDRHHGIHRERNPLSIKYLLDAGSVTRESISRFIEDQRWKVNDMLVYPGWDISCRDYKLAKRFNYYGDLNKDCESIDTKKNDIEEIELRKRDQNKGKKE